MVDFYIPVQDSNSYFMVKSSISENFTINSLQKELKNKFNSRYNGLIEKYKKEQKWYC
jgi:hypothetical protein